MLKWIHVAGMVLFGIATLSEGQRVDIAFVLDGSGSIHDLHPDLWTNIQKTMERIIDNLNIGRDSARVAMVTFSDNATVRWDLDRYSDRNSLKNAIENIRFMGGKSNIHGALTMAWKNVFSGSPGDRDQVPDVMVVFSDGYPTLNIDLTTTTAEDIQAAGIMMSAVAIGNRPDRFTLRYMSNIQNVHDNDQLRNQIVFANFMSKLRVETGLTPLDNPCASSPCMNGGYCSKSEDPYGWGFYCWCPFFRNAGGRLCQITNPCVSCPENTWFCLLAITSDKGRYCFATNYRSLLD